MAHRLNTRFVCGSIHSYAQAQRIHESITPIRSTRYDAAMRPLNRKARCYWLLKDGEDYVARMYNTDVVRWKPDGTIVINNGGWCTNSTAEFITRLAPFTAYRRNNKMWLYVKGMVYALDEPLVIKNMEVLNPTQQYRYALNKQRAKELRTSFKPFVAYAQSLLDLIDIGASHGAPYPSYVPFDIADESTYYWLFTQIKLCLQRTRSVNMKQFRRVLWAQAYKDFKCFDQVPVPMGVMP